MKKGCVAWITIVSEQEINEISIHKVLIMSEFLDVFPEEGLPLDREVEFTIDLMPSTKPISIPLIKWYWWS